MATSRLPLFVLGPDLMPMSSTSLRVFEPRYKQMMDDCILDSKPFGYITYDPESDDLGGWTQPAKYGVLVEIEDYEESGSNILISVISGRRFRATEIIQPVLENDVVGTHFPTVDELMEKAGAPPDGKLYLRADVEVLSPPDVDYAHEAFTTFLDLLSPARQILQMSSMYKGQILEFKEPSAYNDDLDRADLLWKVCSALCYDVYLQQEMLSQISFSAVMQICTNKVVEILGRIEEE